LKFNISNCVKEKYSMPLKHDLFVHVLHILNNTIKKWIHG